MFGSRIKRPRIKLPLKSNQENLENCITCSEKATEDVFECWWCESRQLSACLKIIPDQYNALSNLVGNIVFFCSTCLENVPIALHLYETQVCVDQIH